MDNRETRRITLEVMVPVMLTLDVAQGADGAEVVNVRDVDLPTPAEVMEALDHQKQFDELDQKFKLAPAL